MNKLRRLAKLGVLVVLVARALEEGVLAVRPRRSHTSP